MRPLFSDVQYIKTQILSLYHDMIRHVRDLKKRCVVSRVVIPGGW